MLEHHHLRAILPQRYPMLLLDRVLCYEIGSSITAVKAVSGAEPCYRHVPDGLPRECYAYPVSLLIESFGQAAAVLWLLSDRRSERDAEQVPMLAAVRDVQIDGCALPGDTLHHRVRLDQTLDGAAIAVGETLVDGRRVAAIGSLLAVVRARRGTPPAKRAAVGGLTWPAEGPRQRRAPR
jgi:3-hydroxyacyl-[acyl-carrier-protein] dehydratase